MLQSQRTHTQRVWDNKRKFRNSQCALFTSHSQPFEFIVTREQSCRNDQIITWWMWCLRQTSAPDLFRNASTRQPKQQQRVTTISTQINFKCIQINVTMRAFVYFGCVDAYLPGLLMHSCRLYASSIALCWTHFQSHSRSQSWSGFVTVFVVLSYRIHWITYICLFNRFCKSEYTVHIWHRTKNIFHRILTIIINLLHFFIYKSI